MDNVSVKKNISRTRENLHITQEEMAEKLGISRNTYRSIEKGQTRLVNEHLDRIASILDISAEELVLGYAPERHDQTILGEMQDEYESRLKEKDRIHAEQIGKLESTIRELNEKVRLLEELLNTKNEIIGMLRKRPQG